MDAHVEPPLFLAGVPIQRVDETGESGEIHGVVGHECGVIDTVVEPSLEGNAVVFLTQVKAPFHLAVGGQLVEGWVVHGAEVDVSADRDRRGVDDADLEVCPLGGKRHFSSSPATSALSRAVSPTL